MIKPSITASDIELLCSLYAVVAIHRMGITGKQPDGVIGLAEQRLAQQIAAITTGDDAPSDLVIITQHLPPPKNK